jgi:hypothetical protein
VLKASKTTMETNRPKTARHNVSTLSTIERENQDRGAAKFNGIIEGNIYNPCAREPWKLQRGSTAKYESAPRNTSMFKEREVHIHTLPVLHLIW